MGRVITMAEILYQSTGIIPLGGDQESERAQSNLTKASRDFLEKNSRGPSPDFGNDLQTYLRALTDSDPNRKLYFERQFELFKKEPWFREDGWIKYELKRHEIEGIPSIQTFKGWTPSFDFVGSGFKLEDEIDLIKVEEEVKEDERNKQRYGAFQAGADTKGKPRITTIDPTKLAYARAHIGTQELLEQNKERIERPFKKLNDEEIEFIVFRTYRHGPAVWDTLYFFSKGEFGG